MRLWVIFRCKDDKNVAKEMREIQKLVTEIEDKLFALHKDVNFKYKAKYRSLMFNLKDEKNRGLFRKVGLCGSRMSLGLQSFYVVDLGWRLHRLVSGIDL